MNNGRNRPPRKSSSSLVTKAAFRALEARLNPNIKGVPTVAQPRPVTGPSDFWTQRRVQLTFNPGSNIAATLTFGDIVKQLTSAAVTLKVRLRRVTCFGPSGGSVTCTVNIQNFCDSIAGSNPVTSSDRGSATRLPGIKFEIPRLVSDSKDMIGTSTTAAATATSIEGGTIVYDVDLEYQLP